MTRDLVLGTAGHIDHGKTALVKALTGIDCDRLPEERARGITVDIGFAHLALGDFRLGIVDVPGHERFVKNMLAGATGLDAALLVVSAAESVMPQTREHLEILRLLGVRRGAVALTKIDAADATTREVAELEVRDLVRGSFLEGAPLVPVSAVTGEGIDRLRKALLEICPREGDGAGDAASALPFRLSIDRAFVVQGHGTVVTGTVASGSVRVGDELEWHAGGAEPERVRVRGLNNHGAAVVEAHRGQRAALNLAGVPLERVRRGQALAAAGFLVASRVLAVRLTASPELRRPIGHRLPVRLHIGTAEVMAAVSLLDRDRLEAGESGLAQLFLEEGTTVVWGQPFVLRDSTGESTLGGGRVLQPTAGKVRRRHRDWLARLEPLDSADGDDRALAAARSGGYRGLAAGDLARTAGLPAREAEASLSRLRADGKLVAIDLGHRTLLLHAECLGELEGLILRTVGALHEGNPLPTNFDRAQALTRLGFVGDEALLQAATERLIAARKLVGDARRIARTDFESKLSANQRKLKDRIVEAHAAAGLRPPEPEGFARLAGGNASALKDIYEVAVAEGLLAKVSDEVYLAPAVEADMRKRVVERLRASGGATVAEVRDLLDTTRKYAIPICEYLDRIGLTERKGDLRVARAPS